MGEEYRTFPEGDIQMHDKFPVGTYKFKFHPMMGPSIVATHDLKSSEPKIYGNSERRVDKIMRKWDALNRSLGVLLSGEKGMGKSLMTNRLAERMMNEYNMPVFVVDKSFPGIVDFIDENLDECVIIFDEFEKNFKKGQSKNDGEETVRDEQTQFLSLFDGTSHTKRMYVMTVNDLGQVNEFIQNRPGRAHYHMNFTYPDAEAIEEYVKDKVPGVSEADIQTVVRLAMFTKINYDHLRAITTEMVDNPLGEPVVDLIEDLNIKNSSSSYINVDVHFVDKTVAPLTTKVSTRWISNEGYITANVETKWDYEIDKWNEEHENDEGFERKRTYSDIYIKFNAKNMHFGYDGIEFEVVEETTEIAEHEKAKYGKISKVVLSPVVTVNKQFAAL